MQPASTVFILSSRFRGLVTADGSRPLEFWQTLSTRVIFAVLFEVSDGLVPLRTKSEPRENLLKRCRAYELGLNQADESPW